MSYARTLLGLRSWLIFIIILTGIIGLFGSILYFAFNFRSYEVHYYVCPKDKRVFSEAEASSYNYVCPQSGDRLYSERGKVYDYTPLIIALVASIISLFIIYRCNYFIDKINEILPTDSSSS
jgi:hypothetical protein